MDATIKLAKPDIKYNFINIKFYLTKQIEIDIINKKLANGELNNKTVNKIEKNIDKINVELHKIPKTFLLTTRYAMEQI